MRFVILILLAMSSIAHADPSAELDASDLDFGVLDFDAISVQYLTLANVGTEPKTALLVTSAQITGTADFTFASGTCAGATTCVFATPIAITGTAALLPIQCQATAAGTTETATVVFTSNSNDSEHSTANLTCAVRSTTVSLAPPTVAFGSVDMRAPKPAVQIAHLENQTSNPIAVTAAFSGTNAAQFATTLVPNSVAPAMGELAVPISFTPSAETVLDSATLELTLDGSGTLSATLTGTGVDRHAMLVSLPTFPDTLLDPGYAAAIEPITIANTGGAVLSLTNPTITNSPVWSLVTNGPVDLPGNSTYPLLVRFEPATAGAAPTATFSVDTDDPAHPQLTATLGGNGIDRMASMSPPMLELDYAGVGTTVHGSDPSRDVAITVTNNDPAQTYTINAIRVFGDEGAFEVLNAQGALGPGVSRSFDVAFTPPHPGEFTGTASLFLDLDPVPEASVTLHGTGDFVAVHGDGGCDVAGDAGLVVPLLALLLVMRRRKRALLGFVVASTAAADTRDLDLAIFDPAPTTAAPTFAIPTADVGVDGAWVIAANATLATDPIVLTAPTNTNATLRDRTTLSLGGAFAFGEMFEVSVHVPLYLQSGQDASSATMFGEPDVSATAFGDLELDGKALFSRYHGPAGDFATGIAVGLELPTANGQQFAGSAKPEVRSVVMLHWALGRIALDANGGGVVRGAAYYNNIEQKSGFDWGGAVSVHATPHLAFAVEAFGEVVPGGVFEMDGSTNALDMAEALLGAHFQLDHRINIGAAFGHGLTDALGTPGYRGIITITVAPAARSELQVSRSVGDADHDGIPDDLDRCPNEPEDKDGFQDEDGCPDPDNDGDGIPDSKDKCPNEAEDKDGFQDADGCPDLDNDGDGIPDRRDKCPNEPETVNGFQDEDGCPDQGNALVTIGQGKLVLGEQIAFAGAKVDPASFGVLGQLGATLRAHAELLKVKIVAKDKARATLVRDWLVQYGISRDRLDIAVDASVGDRVDFVVAEKS
ncbi:MAG TPA: choice-of-anchor D domain-containing protein [Kofleriaceae bacterium]|nr:choice-of-anchor D domain-containing protein [Kofleriaceae bacterium]